MEQGSAHVSRRQSVASLAYRHDPSSSSRQHLPEAQPVPTAPAGRGTSARGREPAV
ncbi:MAG: hypothetical protein ACYS5V_05140 [Planctomycetota bacterium]|jgi:hypothetical protein